MTMGMLGWAGGGGGPDFFINMYKQPATHWAKDHTIWGGLANEDSLKVVDSMFELHPKKMGGMTFLDEELHFDIIFE